MPHPEQSQSQDHGHAQVAGQTCKEQASNPAHISHSIHVGAGVMHRAWNKSEKVLEAFLPGCAGFCCPDPA